VNVDPEALQAQVDAVLNEELYWFPVRHHSVSAARHLDRVIAQRRPKVIFIEGPAEAQSLAPFVTDEETRPPIAIYSSYRDDDNVLGLAGIASPSADIPARFAAWYPLLTYSPEYVAMQAAARIKADVVLIDLPHYAEIASRTARDSEQQESTDDSSKPQREGPRTSTGESDHLFEGSSFFQSLARAAGYKSWDETWDSLFESGDETTDVETFRRELASFSAALRATLPANALLADGTIERERHFLMTIRSTLAERKLKPCDAMVVCGGLHLFLDRSDSTPPPPVPVGTAYATLVPFSYFQVSELSGYRAGNRAPQFYQTDWDLSRAGRRQDLLAEHVVAILKQARHDGCGVSSADAISISQHARMLAGLRGRATPILDDICDAVITCCCKGNPDDEGLTLQHAIDAVNIGNKIGKVTSSIGRLPIVADFYVQLQQLDLAELFTHEKRVNLELDKRQPLHERRSVFLHRLRFFEVPLCELKTVPQPDLGSGLLFRESWAVRWSPAVEPALVEQNLYGDTLEAAVISRLREQLAANSHLAGAVCGQLRQAIEMDLPNLVAEVQTVCGDAVDNDSQFVSLATALTHLTIVDQYALYRSVRRNELADLIGRCFDRACFALPDVASAPEDQQGAVVRSLQSLAEILLRRQQGDGSSVTLDRDVFVEHLTTAANDSTVPFLQGAFVGMLAELREINPQELAARIAAFAATTADQMIFAGDFLEGVLAVSRTSVMLGAVPLVGAIDQLLRSAEWTVFLTMLPRLRAAFERLDRRQVDSIADVVARRYGLSLDRADELTELKTSVGAAALIAEIDLQVAEIMSKWSL
jgi:hypothetical protein